VRPLAFDTLLDVPADVLLSRAQGSVPPSSMLLQFEYAVLRAMQFYVCERWEAFVYHHDQALLQWNAVGVTRSLLSISCLITWCYGVDVCVCVCVCFDRDFAGPLRCNTTRDSFRCTSCCAS
jgi:hypothetical protein